VSVVAHKQHSSRSTIALKELFFIFLILIVDQGKDRMVFQNSKLATIILC